MKIFKTIDLRAHSEDVRELERLHYEVITKERILALTLSNTASQTTTLFNEYYNEYNALYKAYEIKKDYMYKTFILPEIVGENTARLVWEVQFSSEEAIIYEP